MKKKNCSQAGTAAEPVQAGSGRSAGPVNLPEERNVPYETKPENIQLAVNKNGDVFWNEKYIGDKATLMTRLQAEAQKRPQPEVHIRGDQQTHFDAIDQVINATKQAGIGKIAFVTTPPVSP